MNNKFIGLSSELYNYALGISLNESEVLYRLRKETFEIADHNMQISPEQGQFIAFLLQLIVAKRALEIGVYTGYSSIWIAQALSNDGHLIACDNSEEWTAMAKRYWSEADVQNKIDLRIGLAENSMKELIINGHSNFFDFIFIDADKRNYDKYYELGIELLRQNGLMAIDNVLWHGKVANSKILDEDTCAIRGLNEKIYADCRVSQILVPFGDGLTLIRKLI